MPSLVFNNVNPCLDRSEQEKSVEFEEAASPLEVNRTPSREKVDAEVKIFLRLVEL